jgi:hypothetical protein
MSSTVPIEPSLLVAMWALLVIAIIGLTDAMEDGHIPWQS